jgi:hypothetical protein
LAKILFIGKTYITSWLNFYLSEKSISFSKTYISWQNLFLAKLISLGKKHFWAKILSLFG